ncbi:MAG: ABC transporter ATP-binding protein [Bacteroidales bacterium]
MIKVEGLRYTYQINNTPTIKGLSFNIGEGEIFGFLGPSGAGKSTTQNILTRLLRNYSGHISILNKELNTWNNSYYEHIGVGFELPNHYLKLTAKENLEFFSTFYKREVKKPAELLGLVGLENDADKKVSEFSKGMKMRLNFVRAFMHNPEIVFFDEPTSGLDPVNAKLIKDIILDLKARGKTIFVTTHNMYDADKLCDRVAFIIDGEIKLIDQPKKLKLEYGQRKVRVEYTNGQTFTKEFALDFLGENSEFLSLIKNERIDSIHTEEATLEDVFIKVTGRNLV